MLTLEGASNCGLVGSIIASVKTFGQALKDLRGDRTGVQVAAIALGPESTAEQQRDFGNYLSRIERDEVPGVGLSRLRLIAKGLEISTLSAFFYEIESRITVSGRQEGDKDHAASAVSQGERDHEPRAVSTPDAVALNELRAFVTHLAQVLAAAAKTGTTEHRSISGTADPKA